MHVKIVKETPQDFEALILEGYAVVWTRIELLDEIKSAGGPEYHFYEVPEDITVTLQVNDIRVWMSKGYKAYVMNERGKTIDTIYA